MSNDEKNINFLMKDEGISREEAEAKWEDLKKTPPSKLMSTGNRLELVIWGREFCAKCWEEKKTTFTANEFFEWAKEVKGYEAQDAKGCGDALGNSSGGLFLMAEKKKLKSKKLYRVPNPKTCTDFYSRGALLPKDYYGEEYYRKLRDSQLRKKSSTFVDDRIQSLEVANELEQ